MTAFTTHLSLGQKAYVVKLRTDCDYYVLEMTVGQIRVTETHPKHRVFDDPLFCEVYMCEETGVGSGTLWQYGKNIFANEADAKSAVTFHEQRAYKQRAEREARVAEQCAQNEHRERQELARLSEKYAAALDPGAMGQSGGAS